MEPLKVVEDLIKCCPDKAKEILLRYCKADRDVLNEMMSSLLAAKNGQDLTTHAPNGADVTPTARYQGAYHGAHEIEAARPQQKMRQLSTNTRQYSLLSPPRTASSVTSHSVKDEFTAGEDIMLLIPTDRGITKEVVRMRTAPVENSLIAEDVIHGRDLVSSLCAVEQQHVYVPRGVDFEELDTFGASYSIKLTWRRSTAGSSHVTIFYVVRKGLMDTDVVLGAKDSGEDTSGHAKTAAQRQREYRAIDHHHNMPPAAPDPALSYHLSALYDGLSAVTATQQRPFGHNSMAHQYQETHRPRMEQHPVRAHAPSANPTSEIDPNRAQDRIRLNIVWDTASINVWLGLTEPSDTFFREFQTEIEKRKKIITDRALLTIIVSNEKSTPAERSYRMELAEDCLDADWDITKEWLEDNKRDKAPHIYGRVEVDEG